LADRFDLRDVGVPSDAHVLLAFADQVAPDCGADDIRVARVLRMARVAREQ
jgi:hypothetical protein